uniref:ATP synthase F0 subunit 6 n=2 Tax=unclassified Hiatella TaxID=2619785 RepID=A0AA51UHU1_9BIVA|nr:ATP synthase F0 subunit 6 [Hiatella sp. J HML-2015]WMW23655.1 ATP synthase F0 subunit 6 [Hiatella sp. J YW-2023]
MMSDLFSRMDHSPIDLGLLVPLYWFVVCSWLLFFLNSMDYWYTPSTFMIYCLEWIEHGQYEVAEDMEKEHRWSTVGGYASFFLSIMLLMAFVQSFSFNPFVYAPNMFPTGLLCCSSLLMAILAWLSFSRFDRPKFIGEMWFPEFGFVVGVLVFQLMFYVWMVRSLTLMARIMVNVFIGHIMVSLYCHGITFSLMKMFFVLDGGFHGSLVWCTFMKLTMIPVMLLKVLATQSMLFLELFTGCAQLWVFGVLVNMYGNEVL